MEIAEKAGLTRPRSVGISAPRHTYLTIAEEALDFPAIAFTMGHSFPEVAAVYRQRLGDDRLRRPAEHVRGWLLGVNHG